MKSLNSLMAVLVLSGVSAQAGVSFSSGEIDLGIPDGNPTGISSGINVSGVAPVLTDVTVTINVSGGFNGDLVCYLSYGSSSVTLLNRIGSSDSNPFGSGTAGFTSFTFSDTGATGLHSLTGISTAVGSAISGYGAYQPDGASLDTTFGGVNGNGTWTIFFADMAGGGGSGPSTLNSWSLDITAVPEPVNLALGIFAGVGFVVAGGRWLWRKRAQAVV